MIRPWHIYLFITMVSCPSSLLGQHAGVVDLGKNCLVAYPPTDQGLVTWSPGQPEELLVLRPNGSTASRFKVPSEQQLATLAVTKEWQISSATKSGAVLRWSKDTKYRCEVVCEANTVGKACRQLSERVLCWADEDRVHFFDLGSLKRLGNVKFEGGLNNAILGPDGMSVLLLGESLGQIVDLSSMSLVGDRIALSDSTGLVAVNATKELVAIENGDRVEVVDLVEQSREYLDGDGVVSLCFGGKKNRLLAIGRNYEQRYKTDIWDLGDSISEFSYKRSIDDRNGGPIAAIPSSEQFLYFSTTELGDQACLCRMSVSASERIEFPSVEFWCDESGDTKLYDLCITSNGEYVFASSGSGTVSIWKVVSDKTQFVHVGGRNPRRTTRTVKEALLVGERLYSGMSPTLDLVGGQLGVITRLANGDEKLFPLSGLPLARKRVFEFVRESANGLGDGLIQVLTVDVADNGSVLAVNTKPGLSFVDVSNASERVFIDEKFLGGWVSSDGSQGLGAKPTGTLQIDLGRQVTSKTLPWRNGSRSPDGRLVPGIVFEGGKHAILDVDSGTIVSNLECDYLSGRTRSTVSSDGKYAAVAGGIKAGRGTGVQVFGLETTDSISRVPLELSSNLVDVGFLPSGRTLAVCDTDGVNIFDYRRKRSIRRFPLPEPETEPEDSPAELSSIDPLGIRDGVDPRSVGFFERANIIAMSVHPTLDIVGIGGHDFVAVFDAANGELLWQMSTIGKVSGLRFAKKGKLLVYGAALGRIVAVSMSDVY